MAVEGKALGSPRGGFGKPVPSESPSSEPCDVSRTALCESSIRVPCESPSSALYESPIRVTCESPSPALCDVSSQCPTSHRAQRSAMYRARALRVTEPSTLRCAGSNRAGAHATFLSCKPALLCLLSIGGYSWIEKPDELSLYSCVGSPLGRYFPRAFSPEEGLLDDL